ncbi:ornithine cyclodeaminase family protein [Hyunsoonleella flava]|uniref:Ornithine cyclodeaminase family protein n=1 Tax=Hyunsoonleella flava TaxID=2527939 RepID=A0A4V2JA69_9FLAO|nr:ornithine cyclodeaminase family protein [Hyunsoonleella flava]TBN04425.1 ornithine cyclodeaminase family protein [Hyunsoonleella flava]
MSKITTLLLSATDVNSIMNDYGKNRLMDDLIFRLINEFKNFNPEETTIPIRSGFNYTNDNPGLVEWMPVYKKGEEVVIKVVGYHPKNPANFNLPTILSTISSYDTKTGHLKGLADGVLLTALRTGAASAVATKYLAHPKSETLGLVGCGAQCITQLHAISRLFPIKKVLIFDTDVECMDSFSKRIEILDLNIEVVSSNIQSILQESDIVCTATSIDVGEGPLFDKYDVKEHLHINAIGSDFPGKIELPLSLLRNSFVCPDFTMQAKIEGECQQLSDDEIGSDLVGIIQNYDAFKEQRNSLTVFDSTGLALEDQVVMDLFMDLAKEFSIGIDISLENISKDVKNPYHFIKHKANV